MQAELTVKCSSCGQEIGSAHVDTADMPDELQATINKVILAHRANCRIYNEREWAFMEAIQYDRAGLVDFRKQYRTVEGVKVKP